MSKDQLFKFQVDYEDGSKDGIHFHGLGTEATAREEVTKKLPAAYFEQQEGIIYIWPTAAYADDDNDSIGWIEPGKE